MRYSSGEEPRAGDVVRVQIGFRWHVAEVLSFFERCHQCGNRIPMWRLKLMDQRIICRSRISVYLIRRAATCDIS